MRKEIHVEKRAHQAEELSSTRAGSAFHSVAALEITGATTCWAAWGGGGDRKKSERSNSEDLCEHGWKVGR